MTKYSWYRFTMDVCGGRPKSNGKKPKIIRGSNDNDTSVYRVIGENRENPIFQAPVLS